MFGFPKPKTLFGCVGFRFRGFGVLGGLSLGLWELRSEGLGVRGSWVLV